MIFIRLLFLAILIVSTIDNCNAGCSANKGCCANNKGCCANRGKGPRPNNTNNNNNNQMNNNNNNNQVDNITPNTTTNNTNNITNQMDTITTTNNNVTNTAEVTNNGAQTGSLLSTSHFGDTSTLGTILQEANVNGQMSNINNLMSNTNINNLMNNINNNNTNTNIQMNNSQMSNTDTINQMNNNQNQMNYNNQMNSNNQNTNNIYQMDNNNNQMNSNNQINTNNIYLMNNSQMNNTDTNIQMNSNNQINTNNIYLMNNINNNTNNNIQMNNNNQNTNNTYQMNNDTNDTNNNVTNNTAEVTNIGAQLNQFLSMNNTDTINLMDSNLINNNNNQMNNNFNLINNTNTNPNNQMNNNYQNTNNNNNNQMNNNLMNNINNNMNQNQNNINPIMNQNNMNQIMNQNNKFNANNFINNTNNNIQMNTNNNIFNPFKPTNRVTKFDIKNIYTDPTLIGLNNIGATCFMNSTLQCLSQTEDLTNYFLNEKNEDNILNNNLALEDENSLQLCPVYLDLIHSLWSKTNKRPISPNEFMETVEAMNSLFKQGQAGDSKDFIIFILEQLHKELKKSVKNNMNNIINQQTNQYDKETAFNNFFDDFKGECSIISDTFFGFNETTNVCLNCKNIYNSKGLQNPICYNYGIFNVLIFPLEEVKNMKNNSMQINNSIQINNNRVSLYECFFYNQKTDLFTGENRNYCNICNQLYDSEYTCRIFSSPIVLILILNRGKDNMYNVKLDFDEKIDLTNFVIMRDTNNLIYELYGVITHIGQSGPNAHFVATCKSPIDHRWYRYNDAMVHQINNLQKELFDFGTPYILFYRKVKQ